MRLVCPDCGGAGETGGRRRAAMTEPGTLSHGAGGALHISVDAEEYRIEAEDLKNLLFYGRAIPICEDRSRTTPGGILVSEISIEGHAAMNASDKAVVLHTRVGSYVIPLISFQRVARGEAISAPLFPLVPEAYREHVIRPGASDQRNQGHLRDETPHESARDSE